MTNTAQANQPDNDTLDMHSPNLVDDNVQKIMALFPNCITESEDEHGKLKKAVDFDLLRQELSQSLVEGGQERYRLDWPGKRQAILEANSPIAKTLRPTRDESVNFDTTENLFIEGDNLDALKLLQESYLGKVKMIYIDPPYNTGSDFIYKDDFSENTADFLERSEQVDEEGNRLIDNPESNGRFHSDWLTMMYSRLKLARNLLADDGVIFISIDDNEQGNLKKICCEIFGSNLFVGLFPWRKRTAKSDVPFGVSSDYEYVMAFAKSPMFTASIKGKERKYYETGDFPGRPWRTHDLTKQTSADERPNSYFTMVNPKTGAKYPANPNRTWAITEETFEKYYELGKIVFPEEYEFLNINNPVMRYFKDDDIKKAGTKFGRIAVSTKLPDHVGMSLNGTKEITDIFEGKVFSFPKPINLIKHFTNTIFDSNALVLDFFSGSSTTAHAVLDLNAEDGGSRNFIMVQLDERTEEKSEAYKAGFKYISEISKERIRRAGKKILADNQDKDGIEDLDIGFRVLKIDSTNMKEVYYTPDEYSQADLNNLESHIKEDRTGEDLLFQVMLDWGVPLSLPIEVKQIQGSLVYYVGIDSLVACFDTLTTDLIDEISKDKPLKFVSSELAIAHDEDKTNIKARFAQLSPDTQVKFI